MLKFGVIAEGETDQAVIRNILLGCFQHENEEPFVNPVQPPFPGSPGGWTRVFDSLRRGMHQEALQFNDFVVIHIDTDVQEETGFDVPRRERGKELSVPDRVSRVIERLKLEMDADFYQSYGQRLLFAVAVDSIECWILPLLYSGKKAEKTTGCLKAADTALGKAKKSVLSVKFPVPAYDEASRGYTKQKTLMELRNKNPSLELFVKQLDGLGQTGSRGE